MTLRPVLPVLVVLLLVLPALTLAVRLALGPMGTRWAWWRRAGMLALVGVIGLGPSSLASTADNQHVVGIDVFFVVDRTGTMAAEDWGDGTRLDGVRRDMATVVGALPGARFSVITWGAEATRELPLTTDARAVLSWADTLRQEITPYSAGSNLHRPYELLKQALHSAAESNPHHARVVFLMSDGETTVGRGLRPFHLLAEVIHVGAVLGYGTSEGGPMRELLGNEDVGPDTPYIRDTRASGSPVAISIIDEAALAAVAEELGVPYLHRPGPDPTGDQRLADLAGDVHGETTVVDDSRTRSVWTLRLWPFALALAALLVAEAWSTVRSWRPVRRGQVRA